LRRKKDEIDVHAGCRVRALEQDNTIGRLSEELVQVRAQLDSVNVDLEGLRAEKDRLVGDARAVLLGELRVRARREVDLLGSGPFGFSAQYALLKDVVEKLLE
jgi:hypothetical protein